jgi:hypothetical protein
MSPTLVQRITIVVFMAMLALPLIATIGGVENSRSTTLFEPEPSLSWDLRPRRIIKNLHKLHDSYNAHFAFRDRLIQLHARMKLDVFGVSSSSNVTVGRNGWLFYAGEQIVPDYQRVRPFTQGELAQWAAFLTHRQQWLAARGIPFLFVIVPNPQTIYPEQMPSTMWRAPNPSRMEQLIPYLREHTSVDLLDLRAPLAAAKAHELIVYRTDTHWNQLGGFVGYEQIGLWMQRTFPQWRSFTRADFDVVEVPHWHGGLSYFLGRPEAYSETRYELRWRDGGLVISDGLPLSTDETMDAWFKRSKVVRVSPDGEIESGLMLRDSQFAAPTQFLSRHFRRLELDWGTQLDPQTVETARPNVVIFEMGERFLMNPVPQDPALP